MLRARHFIYVALLVTLAFCRARATDIYDCYNGSSEQGGNRVTVNGIQTNQYVQQSFPGATVTVYLHNTTTLATIYQDAAGTLPLANPFSSSSHSVAFVCAADGRYDFKYSGTGISIPFTVSDIKFCFACSGGGGGGVTPGTPYQVTRYDATGANIQDSTGSDNPANGPTRWVNGLSVEGNALHKLGVNSPNGTTVTLLVCYDPTVTTITQVTTCPVSTTKTYGIADNGAGTTGNVRIADHAYHACVFDGQTVVNDYVGPSSSNAGQCSDLGSTKPNNVLIIGRVTTLNSGANTLATVDLQPWDTVAPGASGGSGTVSNCGTSNSNAYYASPGTVVVCDQFVTDDGAGNVTAKSLGLTDSSAAGYYYQKQGTQPPATPLNTRMDTVPTSVTTYTVIHPGVACTTIGQTETVQSTSTDANGHTVVTMTCGTAGGSGFPELQTNGGDNANCTGILCPLLNNATGSTSIGGVTVTPVNSSGGTVVYNASDTDTHVSTPTAPTLTVNGTPGSTTICYKVVILEDTNTSYGGAGHHTPASSQTCTSTANATLSSSNSITLSAYMDTIYGARCADIYRVSTNGSSPTTTGKIAGCVDKTFLDSGLGGDSTTAPSTDTTVLKASFDATHNCNTVPQSQPGVDGPPCSPLALDEEMGNTFGAPGDTNNPFWTKLDPTVACTYSWTGGMLNINCPSQTGHKLGCVFHAAPTTPYTFDTALWWGAVASGSQTGTVYRAIALRESGTGKIITVGGYNTGNTSVSQVLIGKWTNNNTNSSFGYESESGMLSQPEEFSAQADGTNVVFKHSPDGVTYFTALSETKTTFFTTAPDQYGVCVDANATGTGGAGVDFDRVRRTQ